MCRKVEHLKNKNSLTAPVCQDDESEQDSHDRQENFHLTRAEHRQTLPKGNLIATMSSATTLTPVMTAANETNSIASSSCMPYAAASHRAKNFTYNASTRLS